MENALNHKDINAAIQAWSLPRSPELASLDFNLSAELEASQPPEARGLQRDQVRLMVSSISSGQVVHTRFRQINEILDPGDVLVINTSGTLNAALNVIRANRIPLELHLSTRLPGDLWIVELRLPGEVGTSPYYEALAGEILELPGEARARLLVPYRSSRSQQEIAPAQTRLWIARLEAPQPFQVTQHRLDDFQPVLGYLAQFGFPIRYKYVRQEWPISYYQTVYATEMGSAEMPSAGRAFTPELITLLMAQGVQFAPLILHTGVASLEEHEPPYEEYYRVPAPSARLINNVRSAGGRIIAVGTTSVRALETVAEKDGSVHAGEGWTDVVITPERGLRAVDGLLTGLHEPRSSHLSMLAALAGFDHLRKAYGEALSQGYLWHEFGDLHLILP
jgi:S-adenosylmethionine:tRNA ribosyltransferase-isomerase